jgi:sulfite exporter TauE/SafE
MAITFFQIFFIGLSLSFAGPCLFSCLPVILTYTTGRGGTFRARLVDILIFLSGRFAAYVLLGGLAGFSAEFMHRFIGQPSAVFYKPAAGIITIALAGVIMFQGKKGCCTSKTGLLTRGGLLAAGFLTGVSPCLPLLALLSEIVLISKNVWQGAWYGAAFGLGTFLSAFVVTAGFSGILYRLTGSCALSPKRMRVIQVVCAAILVIIGVLFLLGGR